MTGPPDPAESPLDRVADLFAAALDLEDPAARQAFIDEVRSDDAELAGELEELIDAHLSDQCFLESPLPTLDRELVTDKLDSALVSRRVGPWQIDGVLHHGGMGTVYRAHRVGADFQQQVALKVIRLGTESPEIIRRFTLERQLLARLEHPGIARLLDGGSTEEGIPYLVMELVPGETIDVWRDRESPSMDRILEVVQDVCAAVDFAHRNLVIHRDIKPSNILMTPEGSPKLLDFGIAKLEDVSGDDPTMALTRHRIFTPAYASPEQFRGEPVSTATDVYSLGVLLYRLLTGSPPYTIGEATKGREAERLICETMPVPPSRAAPEQWRRKLGGDLDTIVLKALRKEPERRYPSALALAEDLRRYREGLPVTARPDVFSYRARRFVGRHKAGVAAVAAVLIAVAGGLGAALWQASVAERQRDLARAEAATAESAVEFLKTVLWSGDPWDGADPVETVADVLRYAEAQIGPLLGDEPAARAYILAALSEISVARGDQEQALRFSSEAVEVVESLPDAERGRPGEVYRAHSLALHELGRIDEAHEYIQRAIAILEAEDPIRVESLAMAMNQAGALLGDMGETVEAEDWYRRALAFREEHGATAPDKTLLLLNNLAVTLLSQPDRLEETANAFADVIPVARETGAAAPAVATFLTNHANVLTLLARFDEAEVAYLEALTLMNGSIGPDHPAALMAATSLGSLYEVSGDLEQARSTLWPVLEASLATLSPDHPNTAYTQNVLSTVLCRIGGPDDARDGLAMARASLRSRSSMMPAGHWALASGAAIEGLCLLELGRFDEARPLLTDAIPALSEQRGDDHPLTVRTRDWLARLDREMAGAGAGSFRE